MLVLNTYRDKSRNRNHVSLDDSWIAIVLARQLHFDIGQSQGPQKPLKIVQLLFGFFTTAGSGCPSATNFIDTEFTQ